MKHLRRWGGVYKRGVADGGCFCGLLFDVYGFLGEIERVETVLDIYRVSIASHRVTRIESHRIIVVGKGRLQTTYHDMLFTKPILALGLVGAVHATWDIDENRSFSYKDESQVRLPHRTFTSSLHHLHLQPSPNCEKQWLTHIHNQKESMTKAYVSAVESYYATITTGSDWNKAWDVLRAYQQTGRDVPAAVTATDTVLTYSTTPAW